MNLSTAQSSQRAKEAGMRKVLGPSVSSFLLLFSLDFSRWVILANLIAWPMPTLSWLSGFRDLSTGSG